MKVRVTRATETVRDCGIVVGNVYEVKKTEEGNPMLTTGGVVVISDTGLNVLLGAGSWQAVEIDGTELEFVTQKSRAKRREERQ